MMGDLTRKLRRRFDLLTDYDRRLRERWTADWAGTLPSGALVLDAGAGDAHLAPLFGAQRYVAMDIRPRPGQDVGTVVAADLHRIPLARCSVDHVVCIQVLEHVRDPSTVLGELSWVLKPGGTACLSVPQCDPEHEQPNDFFRFTSFAIRALARQSGLLVDVLVVKGGYFRRLSAELRDLPFVVLPENGSYRHPHVARGIRWVLVAGFTFVGATVLLAFDRFDQTHSYTTGYFCVLRKPEEL